MAEGDTLFIEKLEAEAGQEIVFDQVLAILDGDKATFGAPAVEGASVAATVVKNGKGKKVRVFKYTPKKGYRKRQGHRQPYTKVQILSLIHISGPGPWRRWSCPFLLHNTGEPCGKPPQRAKPAT